MLPTNFMKVDIEAHVKSGKQRIREKGEGRWVATTMPNGIVTAFVVVVVVFHFVVCGVD